MDNKPASFFLIAGEASGDLLGSRLIHALKNEFGANTDFTGIGGDAMLDAGLKESLFPMEELSLMGIIEIAPKLLHLRKRIIEAADAVLDQKPDMLITIDAPDFCFRVAKEVKKRQKGDEELKIVHYVAPSVWAWREGRARKITGFLDGLLCLLPFEPPYFEREGLRAEFIGHSMIESGITSVDPVRYRHERQIPENSVVLGLLPGSRKSEISTTGPVLFEAVQDLCEKQPGLHIIIPTMPHLLPVIRANVPGFNKATVHFETNPDSKFDAFAACDVAMATSGTVGLELAVADIPHVIAYRMNPVTWGIVKRILKVKYAHLANIILEHEAVPEFIQQNCRADLIYQAISGLLIDPEKRNNQRDYFKAVRQAIEAPDKQSPSARAASFIRELIEI